MQSDRPTAIVIFVSVGDGNRPAIRATRRGFASAIAVAVIRIGGDSAERINASRDMAQPVILDSPCLPIRISDTGHVARSVVRKRKLRS